MALGPDWLDPQTLIAAFGPFAVAGVALVVFAENGLLLGFLLPGDSLLFTTGLLVAGGLIQQPLWLVAAVMGAAAFVGDQAGYLIGRRSGPAVFDRPDSRWFKRAHVDRSYAFFEQYGGRTVVLARFVPIVRTFVPVVAGVSGMHYRTFVRSNAVGAVLWGAGVTVLGSLLGRIGFVQHNIELILIAIVGASVIPMGIEVLRARARRAAGPEVS